MVIVVLAAACIAAVVLQDVAPGKWWFHSGSYALVLAALAALLLWRLKKRSRLPDASLKPLFCVTASATLVTLLGLAAGLLGPDTQTYAAAPGATIPVNEPSGSLAFPFLTGPRSNAQAVRFAAGGGRSFEIVEGRRRYSGAYVMWSEPHSVAVLSAADTSGRRLTITQPANASFLSPVLLFSQTAKIGGRNLPVDSFSLPAVQRVVKVVFFPPATLSQIQNRSAAASSASRGGRRSTWKSSSGRDAIACERYAGAY